MNVYGFLLSAARSLSVLAFVGLMILAFQAAGFAEDPGGEEEMGLFCSGSSCNNGCESRTPEEWHVGGFSGWVCQPIGTGCSAGFICNCWCSTDDSNPPENCLCD